MSKSSIKRLGPKNQLRQKNHEQNASQNSNEEKNVKSWLSDRIKEKTTWAGLIVIAGQLGYLSMPQVAALTNLADNWPLLVSTLGGVVAVFAKEKTKADEPK